MVHHPVYEPKESGRALAFVATASPTMALPLLDQSQQDDIDTSSVKVQSVLTQLLDDCLPDGTTASGGNHPKLHPARSFVGQAELPKAVTRPNQCS
eukprot:5598098-Amphidinium_carterae.2